MILAVALLLASEPGMASSLPPGRVELGQKLASGRFNTTVDANGRLVECTVSKSTGDAELDRSFCDVAKACSAESSGNMKAMNACMDRRHETFLHELALQRASGRASGRETVSAGGPEIKTRDISIAAKPFHFEPPVAPAVQMYFQCLIGGLGTISSDITAAFEASIARCAEVRRAAEVRADQLLSKAGWRSAERRRKSIDRTFSEIDASHRDQAQQLRARSRSGSQPDSAPQKQRGEEQ